MSRLRSVVQSRPFLLVVLFCLITVVGVRAFTFYKWKPPQSTIKKEKKIINRIESLKFLGLGDIQGVQTLRLKNISKKNITRINITWPTGEMNREYLSSYGSLEPDQETFLMLSQSVEEEKDYEETMYINMVMFDDGSSEGDWDAVQKAVTERKAQARQYKSLQHKIHNLINQNREFTDSEMIGILESSLPKENYNKKHQRSFDIGVNKANQTIKLLYNQIQAWEKNNKAGQLSDELKGIKNRQDGLVKMEEQSIRLIDRFYLYN